MGAGLIVVVEDSRFRPVPHRIVLGASRMLPPLDLRDFRWTKDEDDPCSLEELVKNADELLSLMVESVGLDRSNE